MHYAGAACDMDIIMDIATRYNLIVIEDAAQAIDSFYKGRPLGSIGHFGCFSFHETKNIQCGEGGMLCINDYKYIHRAEIIWEKGTNRAEFFRGEVNKYGWVDIGSSFLPADYVAGFLLAQLEQIDEIQLKRKQIWNDYYIGLQKWANKNSIQMPFVPDYTTCNGHMFYLVCPNIEFRTKFISYLKENGIHAVFHYLSLHQSDYYKQHSNAICINSDKYSDCLVRLPLFCDLQETPQIIDTINKFQMSC